MATCSYFLCGKSVRTTPGIRRFYFPVNDDVRCRKWIVNSGNSELVNLSSSKLKARFICGEHFRKEDFLSRKLTRTAVPIKYTIAGNIQKTYTRQQRTESIYDDPKPSTSTAEDLLVSTKTSDTEEMVRFLTPELPTIMTSSTSSSDDDSRFLKDITNLPSSPKSTPEKRIGLKRKLVETEKELERVRSSLKRKCIFTAPRSINELPTFPKALTTMQLYHKARSPWLPHEKSTALSLFYKSPGTYKFLRTKGVILPAPSTISKWLQGCNYKLGYNSKLFQVLKLKVETLSEKERQCVLTFDEMAIKQCLEFSTQKDVNEGVEDLGEFGRKPVLAKQALVLLIRGLYSSWKIPVSFYFTATGVKADQLDSILRKILLSLKNIGLHLLAVICDQAPSNQKLFKTLNVTIEKPYFEVDGNRYYAIYDAPHLVKSLRNNLLDGDFVMNDAERISFNDIRKTYALDKNSSTGRALPKLTDDHMNPNPFQKMNVRLAVQVLSHSMCAAIRTAEESGELVSETATNTANFLEIIDNAFDALNSRELQSKKPYNCALSEKNANAFKALDRAFDLMESLKKIDTKDKLKKPPCFYGLQQTIHAIKMLFEDQRQKGYSFLLTARVNQDVLENQFSIYRQRGGYSRNPTVRTFQAAFKSNCVMNLMKAPKTSSYEAHPVRNLLDDVSVLPSMSEQSSDSDSSSTEDNSTSSASGPDAGNGQTSLEKCSTIYFAGYLVKKCLDKFKCKECKQLLCTDSEITDENDCLLFYKNYNINDPCSLKKPSNIQSRFTLEAMKMFTKLYKSHWYKRKLGFFLSRKIKNKLAKKLPQWFNSDDSCKKHKNYILSLLIRTLIFKECKRFSANLKSITQKKSEKLTIIMNK